MEENRKEKEGLTQPLQISVIAHKHLKQLAKTHNRSMKEFTFQMIEFFRRSGIDPLDVKGENATAAIKALDKRLIGFIKTQEKEKLIPLLDELSILSKTLYERSANAITATGFNEAIKTLSSNQKKIFEEIKRTGEILAELKKENQAAQIKQPKKGFF